MWARRHLAVGARLKNCQDCSSAKISLCFGNLNFHTFAWHNIGYKDHTAIIESAQPITTGN
jgi:hypothetical protein